MHDDRTCDNNSALWIYTRGDFPSVLCVLSVLIQADSFVRLQYGHHHLDGRGGTDDNRSELFLGLADTTGNPFFKFFSIFTPHLCGINIRRGFIIWVSQHWNYRDQYCLKTLQLVSVVRFWVYGLQISVSKWPLWNVENEDLLPIRSGRSTNQCPRFRDLRTLVYRQSTLIWYQILIIHIPECRRRFRGFVDRIYT